jgi:hypothetical protein
VSSPAAAQQSLDGWTVRVSDARRRAGSTVGELGATEPLRALPALAFPTEIVIERTASRSALVAFEANHYSVAPAHAGRRVVVRARVGEPRLRIFTVAGALIATHRRTPRERARRSAPASTPSCSSERCSTRSPPSRPAGASETGRRASGHWPSWPHGTATRRPPRR